MSNSVYLDHAATTPLLPEAWAAIERGYALWANPSSPHTGGRSAKAALESARSDIKSALAWDGEVVFTSGASEALAIALQRSKAEPQIISTAEHEAVRIAAPNAAELPLSAGKIDKDAFAAALAQDGRAVVAIQHINSETGTCFYQGSELADMVRASGGLLLADCAQSAGKIPLPDCDMAVISAHKFGGPVGIGALLVKEYAMLHPNGGHERGYRAGTENLPAIMGMAAALKACGSYAHWQTSAAERADFKARLAGSSQVVEFGNSCEHIIALAHPHLRAQAALIRLDSLGFAISVGSACSSGTLKKSRVLDAFGVADDVATRTVRLSVGWNTTAAELNAFCTAWEAL